MFLHIGADVVVSLDDLVAIIDLETARKKEATREFLSFASDDQVAIHIGNRVREKSIIITRGKIYFSPISTTTLLKRTQLLDKAKTVNCC
jgi:hypothetical protein